MGEADLALDLRYALARLSPLLGTHLMGELQAFGHLRGPLNQLRPDLALRVESPGAGPLRVWQTWAGTLKARTGGGGDLALTQVGSGGEARIAALLDPRWLPKEAQLVRGRGRLRFQGSPRRYNWDSRDFPLDGLHLALGARGRLQPLGGLLAGKGVLELQPLLIEGKARVTSPSVAGLALKQLTATGRFHDRHYNLTGQALPQGEARWPCGSEVSGAAASGAVSRAASCRAPSLSNWPPPGPSGAVNLSPTGAAPAIWVT
ncbi:hypothetical protein [Cyanobium sp. ATX-6F1]|uniref:hypothetical protein n=1 Tax=Cyanobium sp. ATX-6F1 TaxID=3137388 RepID=UPI0039BE5ECB